MYGFVGKRTALAAIATQYRSAKLTALRQELWLIVMTDDLYDEINQFAQSEPVLSFSYLSESMESKLLSLQGDEPFAYIEAEYHGGIGVQMGMVWEKAKRVFTGNAPRSINTVLQHLGVHAANGEDEFDAVDLGRHRSIDKW